MSSSSGGVQPNPEKSIPGLSQSELSGMPAENVEAALKTPVKNLGELKSLLIKELGEESGVKLYNSFMKSFAMSIFQQLQESARRAENAARNIRANAP